MDTLTTRSRKRDSPPPASGSDDKQVAHKKQVCDYAENVLEICNASNSATTQDKPSKASSSSTPPTGLKPFLAALATGPAAGKSLLTNAVPSGIYYYC